MPISAKESLSKLNKEIINCKKCTDLVKIRKNPPAAGTGASKARIIIICNYPLADKGSKKNISAGSEATDKFIRKILNKTGLSLTRDTYITHLIKCSPPEFPKDNESLKPKSLKLKKKHIKNCIPFLTREISIITPHIIVSLGLDVSNIILQRYFSIEKKYRNMRKIHMRVFENPSFKLVPFFDPQEVLISGTINEEKYIKEFESLSKFLKIV